MVARIVPPALLLAALTCALAAAGRPPTPCRIDAQPQITQAPLRYLRLRAHLDDPTHWRLATVYLVDVDGPITSSVVCEVDGCQTAPKTTQIEWKTIVEPAGDYEVQLIAVNFVERCVAKQLVHVIGDDLPAPNSTRLRIAPYPQ